MTSKDRTPARRDSELERPRADSQRDVIRYRLRYSPQSAFAATRPGSMIKVPEPTQAGSRTAPATSGSIIVAKTASTLLALVITVAALLAAASLAASPAAARSGQAVPPSACLRSPRLALACELVNSFFDALNRGKVQRACSLLGSALRFETGGRRCPDVLAMSRGTPFRIIGDRTAGTSLLVFVRVGLHELDHWRMLDWVAVIGPEGGNLKILDTKRA
jgi:hypothetical protein